MTRENESNVLTEVLELIAEQGLDGMAEAHRILFNEAMKAERSAALGAGPYERAQGRRGYANGFKPKTLATRLGNIDLNASKRCSLIWRTATSGTSASAAIDLRNAPTVFPM